MKAIGFFLGFTVPFFAIAQTKYIVGYEQKSQMNFSNIKIKKPINFKIERADSLTSPLKDSLWNEIMNSDFLEKMLKESLGEELILYLHVIADSATAELNAGSGSQINVRLKKKYENGNWFTYNYKNQEFEIDSLDVGPEFYLTGQSKEINGLMCYEAKPKDSSLNTVAWVCKHLPSSISPGISIKNLNYGIVEYHDYDQTIHMILRSLQKTTNN